MKATRLLLPIALAVLGGTADISAAWDSGDNVYYLKTSDGLEQYTVEGTITFKSQKGTTIQQYRDCGVVFSPANPGEVIKITVESNDLADGNYLLLYNHEITQIGSGVSDGVDQSRYLPAGWDVKYTADNVGESYTSTDPGGKLSFGFHSGSSKSQTGFTITVSSISLKDMEYVGATATDVETSWRGRLGAPLGKATVTTDGGSNPLTLNSLTIDYADIAAAGVTNIKVYNGKISDTALIASAESGATEITISDITLKSGDNNIIIAGDLPADLTGTVPAVSFSGLRVAGQDRTIPATAPAATVSNEIRIAGTPVSYIISDAADFYDDGGADGKISEQFNGTVTFVPATEGMAIKVDVQTLNIFNTSSTGKNDILTFYNGRTADDANLITTLLKDTKIVKSTAPDGSMTVKLVSTTGIPAQGWEAVVSQFLPGNMTLSGVSASTVDADKTVSALDKEILLGYVDVQTDNTAEPLTVTAFDFASQSPQLLSALKVYYLGENQTATTKTLFASNQSIAATTAVSGEQSLIEGHNYFAVTADMGATALNGETVNVSLTGVTVGGNTVTAEGLTVSRTVKNAAASSEGEAKVINISDTWNFTPTYGEGAYSSNYAPGQENQTTTFVPTVEGSVAQIDFTKFKLQSVARFYIYSGRNATAENLLWESTSTTQETGPGRSLRSTAEDGSMTIVFNPGTAYSYGTAEGWTATVKPFVNHNMTIAGSTATRPDSNPLPAGGENQKMLDFTISTEGNLTTKTLAKINLDIAGHEALSSVSIYCSTENDRSTATLFGTSENVSATTSVTGTRNLIEGQNYFWVEANVASAAPSETEVRVGVASVEDSDGNTDAIPDGNPEGSRIVKNILILETGTHNVSVAQETMWYDDGGSEANITKNIKATYTFVPAQEGYAVTLDARDFSIGNGKMMIYSGRTVDESKIIGKITGYSTTTGPANLRSTAEDGSLTVTVKGPTGTSLRGFAIAVGLQEQTDFALSSLSASAASTATDVLRGASDQPIALVKASVAGDRNDASISDLTFNVTGAENVSAFHLYYTGKNSKYTEAIAVKVADATAAPTVSFAAPTDIKSEADHYFVLTADILPAATAGQTVSVSLASAKFNGSDVADIDAQPVSRTVKAGLKGEFTVGNGGDYTTLAAATQALQGGVEGAVIFNIADGVYNENIVVENIPGTSATSPVTFRSQSGDKSSVTLNGHYTDTEADGIVRITATPWVTIENISIAGGEQYFENAVYVSHGSTHFTLRGCSVTAEKVTGYSGGMYLVYSKALDEAGGNNDYMTIENNIFTGGRIALNLGGTYYVALPKEKGLRIVGNTVSEAGYKAVYVAGGGEEMLIHGNTVMQSASAKGYNAMDISRMIGGEISSNKVITNGNEESCGISLRDDCYGTEQHPIRIFNNDIVLTAAKNLYAKALNIGAACHDTEVAFNTVRIAGDAGYAFATNGSGTTARFNVHDNIFSNHCTGTNGKYAVVLWNDTDAQGMTFERNDIYSTDPAGICKNDTEALTIEGFNTLFSTGSNISIEPQYLSDTDSRLLSADGMTGLPESGIEVDIDGNTRSLTAPTLGAYEFSEISFDAPAMAEGYPRVGSVSTEKANVSTKWNMNATQYALALPATDEAPTAERLKLQSPVSVTADSESITTFTSLTPSTEYRAYFLAVSSVDTPSEVMASEVFTTAREILPLTIDKEAIETAVINAGEDCVLTPAVTGGDIPYTYAWTSQAGENLGSSATLTVAPEVSQRYLLTVTSADGQSVSAYLPVEVIGQPMTAGFDDNFIADGASLYPPKGSGKFYSGSYGFNYTSATYGTTKYWYGFVLSNEADNSYSGLSDQFRSAPGGGFDSQNYCVGYPQGLNIEVTNNAEGEIIAGAYVTNAAYSYSSMTLGDGFAQPFTQGSWFKVTATGTAADGSTKSVDFYLGDYRDASSAEHYIIDSWEWLDLRPLGRVRNVTFTFDGSEKGQWGLNTPTYICLDRFGDLPVMETVEVAIPDGESIDISQYFTEAADGSVPHYFISAIDTETLPVVLDGTNLSFTSARNAGNNESVAVMAGMTQRGKSQYVRLEVSHDPLSGIDGSYLDNTVRVYADAETLSVITGLTGYKVEVFAADGKRVHSSDGHDGDCTVSLGGLNTGVYIVKVSNDNISKTFRRYIK